MLPLFAVLAFLLQSYTYTGILVDVDCRAAEPTNRCAANSQTKHLGLMMPEGDVIPLDPATAQKAAGAMVGQPGEVNLSITGEINGGLLQGQSVSAAGVSVQQPVATPAETNPAPSCAGLELPDGSCYHIDVRQDARVRKPRNANGARRITLTGTVDGDRIRVDTVTVR